MPENSKYDSFKDEELIDMLRDGSNDVTDYLMIKYKNMVRKNAKNMYILGADEEDLIQEGMIGLYKAVRDYDSGRDASFITFAQLCVSRQMYNAIQAAGRQKHMMLNSYTSIYEEDFHEEGGANPEDEFLDRERALLIEETFEKELSSFEKQVLDLKLVGLDYRETAAILGKSVKSVDNALNRLKTKLKKVMEHID